MERKKIICIIMAVIIMIGGCGCTMKNQSKNTEQKVINEMISYLEERYGYIDYDVIGFITAGWDHSYDLLNMSTTIDGVKEEFCVKRYEKDGEFYCEDNYFGLVIREDFENTIDQYAKKYFSEYKIFSPLAGADGDVYPNSFNELEDVISRNNEIGYMFFYMFIMESSIKDENNFNELSKSFVDDVNTIGIKLRPYIICVKDEDFQRITRGNHSVFSNNGIMLFEGNR